MINEHAYPGYEIKKHTRTQGFWCAFMMLFFLFIMDWNRASAQEEPDFEEITVFVYIRQIGGTDMPAYIHGDLLYLPVPNTFSFLKILNLPTPGYDTVSGFFINEQSPYLIDRVKNEIQYHSRIYKLNDGDLIRTENNLYLKINYFGEIFGLECNFSFSSMSVTMSTKLELPVIKEMRQTLMRANLSRLRGDIHPDTVIKRNYPAFHFGAADWALTSTQRVPGKTDTRIDLSLGALLAGGEALLNLNYSTNQPFDNRQQFYSWHFANNDLKVFKQITLGKIPTLTSLSVGGAVVGAQISNTPTTFQRSFCSYTLSDYTEPGWIVELYVNYVLVDYVKADASGYFSFEVPLVYGNSLVKLRFYGPWGEEHTREQNISIPFNFLRPGHFEYTLNAGFVENYENGKYSKLNLNFGASKRLTLGGGVEYLSTVWNRPVMPFGNFSLRLATNLLVSAEYMPGVRFRGVFTYRHPSNLLLELYYTNMALGQTAIHTNYTEERKAVISVPLRTRTFSSLVRMTLNQYIVPGSDFISSELLMSGGFLGVSTNLTTTALFLDPRHPYIYSTLSLGIKLPAKIIMTPQVQYIFSQNKLLTTKLELEKRVFKNGTVNILGERNFINRITTFQVGIRYDFSSVQTNLSVRNADNVSSFIEFARGSMVYEGKGGKVKFSRNSSVGKGGIIVVPFLDLNGNGRYDKSEQKVIGLNVRISGGRIEKNYGDSTIRVSELEPFSTYYIELDRAAFDNVSWQLPKPVISITVNPNQYRTVQVPVKVVGEASGVVFLENDTMKKGFGRIKVSFFRNDSSFAAGTVSEDDGYFTFFGLSAGHYYAIIDPVVLKRLNLESSPALAPFEIKGSVEGDRVDGLEFILRPRKVPPGE